MQIPKNKKLIKDHFLNNFIEISQQYIKLKNESGL